MATLILQQNCKSLSFWSGVELCGVECGVSAFKSRFLKSIYSLENYTELFRETNVQNTF